MIIVNGIIINEILIKVAVPYTIQSNDGIVDPFPVHATKITFTDNTEQIFKAMDTQQLFTELRNQTMK